MPSPADSPLPASGSSDAATRMDAQFIRTVMRLFNTEERDDFHRAVGEALRDLKAARAKLPPSAGPVLVRSAARATPPKGAEPEPPVTPSRRDDELCAKCGFTYAGHIGNTGCLYPCWTPSGTYRAVARPTREEPNGE